MEVVVANGILWSLSNMAISKSASGFASFLGERIAQSHSLSFWFFYKSKRCNKKWCFSMNIFKIVIFWLINTNYLFTPLKNYILLKITTFQASVPFCNFVHVNLNGNHDAHCLAQESLSNSILRPRCISWSASFFKKAERQSTHIPMTKLKY